MPLIEVTYDQKVGEEVLRPWGSCCQMLLAKRSTVRKNPRRGRWTPVTSRSGSDGSLRWMWATSMW